ncbi:MAG: glycolate oxidase subunit GlcE [Neomegalonema sp.]|nr:glycolate oxidase subunit GlcE [Neomegalonema sp.]
MGDIATPASEAEISEIVRAAHDQRAPLEISGGGTRRELGRPAQADRTLALSALTGTTLYDPGALTIVARAGEPLSKIEAALAAERQRLPFEPMDHRALLGSSGEPTVGGVVACNISGPRRVQAGACRDSLLGVRFVDGQGRIVKNGGRVMKNVTGYDLSKLMCGAYGTLGVLTEVALKVAPAPERTVCLLMKGLSDERAIAALAAALGTPYEVNGAAHLPADCTLDGVESVTMIRLEGFEANIRHRAPALQALFAAFGETELIEDPDKIAAGWAYIRDVAPFVGQSGAVWRLSLKPSDGPTAVSAIRRSIDAKAFYDWGGGLVWLLTPEASGDGGAGAQIIRDTIAPMGGHATLVRASAPIRAAVAVFHPEPPRLAALSDQLRSKFDPAGILNPGRMAAPRA